MERRNEQRNNVDIKQINDTKVLLFFGFDQMILWNMLKWTSRYKTLCNK